MGPRRWMPPALALATALLLARRGGALWSAVGLEGDPAAGVELESLRSGQAAGGRRQAGELPGGPEHVGEAAGPPLSWPEVCQPLYDRVDGDEYPWAQRCRGYTYGGGDHLDALLCGLDGRWHHSSACELFRIAASCLDRPCTATMAATADSLREGLRRGEAPIPRGAGEMLEVLLVGALPAVLESAPGGSVGFRAFVAMYAAAELCLRPQPKGVQRVYHLRPEAIGRKGCADLLVEHFEHVFATASPGPPAAKVAKGAAPAKDAAGKFVQALRRHVTNLLPEGPLGVADVEPAERGHYARLPPNAVWSRFVVRVPRPWQKDSQGHGWAELQEGWGWQNAWSALRLAARLDELLDRGGDAGEWLDVWLEALGAERQAMLDGREAVDGEQRDLGYQRWRASQRTLTPISGQYRPMWRAALLRRAAEPEGGGLFELPTADDTSRGWRCGAVLSWHDLPTACVQAQQEVADASPGPAGAPANASLVPLADGRCRVVLSRALLRAPADAAALRVGDCDLWYGVPAVMHNASYALRPQWLHADFPATVLLKQHILPAALARVASAVQAIRDRDAGLGAAGVERLLLAAAEGIAEFTYLLFNGALYTRGSAAIAVLSHHAMYLWMLDLPGEAYGRAELARHRLQALRCLPPWRADTMPDIEAASSHTAEQYVRSAYWASFEPSAEAARGGVLRCLAAELQASPEAEARGREDAERMREVLAQLRGSSS